MLGVIFNCNHELSLDFERELICFNSYSYDFYCKFFFIIVFFEATCMLFSNFMRAFHKEEILIIVLSYVSCIIIYCFAKMG